MSEETKAIRYCKAYYLRDIKKFNHWTDLCEQAGENLQDDDIVYMREDLHLVRNPTLPDAASLLRSITPEWQQFCRQVLQFSVPEKSLLIAEKQAVTAEHDGHQQGK